MYMQLHVSILSDGGYLAFRDCISHFWSVVLTLCGIKLVIVMVEILIECLSVKTKPWTT